MSELLKINVNEHTEKKNGLTYLSWAWAWAKVLEIDPSANWCCHTYGPQGSEEPCMRVGKTAMVHVSVTIKGTRRECMLPVMDHRNKAIPDPDAFQVNTAIMRCLAKAIAMHGLGLYIYAGEDLPEGEEQPKPRPVSATAGAMDRVPAEELETLRELAAELVDLCERQNAPQDAVTLLAEQNLDNDQKVALWEILKPNSKTRSAIKNAQMKAAA